MTTPEIARIRAALERFKNAGDYTAEAYAAVLELDGSTSTEALTAVLKHIDAQQAEIAALQKANGLLDSALKEAFPRGASGVVFEHWNAARRIEKETL